ncbi:glycoside hydrolase family 38 C-terminal domain-containing protein [Actinoallomurus bryophytorum]|uniref:Alpha-mannosidase n=1 Tax=Actinoallomurus bryophytorum TaxID=1490222 RepID=A0A543CTA7_9ACTN|nr:glycoside hydrolase family 38 C-terminal domain-containing protein [Actinoallomurus bryophytorum]TQM00342.1 alpha-mannosidase [Actinoallomurus bryophytorum]
MHDDRRQVEDRLGRVVRERIVPATYAARLPMALEVWHVPGEPVPIAEALTAAYAPFEPGSPWGRPWSTSWVRATATVPAEWADRHVEAIFDLGFTGAGPGFQAEALVYDLDGKPVKGIEPMNQYVPVGRPASGGEQVGLLVEMAANPDVLGGGFVPTPLGDKATAGDEPLYRFGAADLAVLDEDVWHLRLDIEVLSELMHELHTGDPRRHEILRALEHMLDRLDIQDVAGTAAQARNALADVLARPAHASAHTISGTGHAHIDSAWLWPLRETQRKTARTFSNVTALAKDYPELVFSCSQAQQYAWVRDRYPEIFGRMREAIKAGQWAPVGGMWVEADGNLPGGEALARQLVHGKRFFLDEFGVETRGVWLPDSFGYTAAYPQLAVLAGNEWFLTQKISWNQTNKFPHHTFWWEGIDGTRIFTHFPPADTYNGTFHGSELAHAVRNYADKGGGTRSLLPFGHGDGGGGPTREMLEKARRLRDLEGSPKVVVENPDDFFAAARAEYPHAAVWSGELYLELHRATYTTQARTKAGNRRSEHLLREAELWSATAAKVAGLDYPYEDLDRLWKTVLLNQFHDILPGSSIAWVHREAEATYAKVRTELEGIIGTATAALAGEDGPGRVFNTSPQARAEVVTVPSGLTAGPGAQALADGSSAVFVSVPGSGSAEPGTAPAPAPVTVTGSGTLDNGLVRVEVDGDGLLASVRDLVAGREVLAPGSRGNLLQLHTDLPNLWDAWDIDRHYRRQHTDLTEADEVTVLERGPLVASIRVTRTFGDSRIEQVITVTAGSPAVRIDTAIDWHERERILKMAFPLDVHADRTAAEIQFGHVFRPTHTNTSWDSARFETACHRWIHLAEPGYGVALVNDATYGHDVTRTTRPDGGTTTTARYSLVRAPRSPDPEADQGPHRMSHTLLPGATTADAVAGGYALNLPLRVTGGGSAPVAAPLVSVDGDAASIEAVKLADDRSGDVVVRVYESLGGRAHTRLRASFPIAGVEVTDLLERPLPEESATIADDGSVPLTLRPFQVLTLRLRTDR